MKLKNKPYTGSVFPAGKTPLEIAVTPDKNMDIFGYFTDPGEYIRIKTANIAAFHGPFSGGCISVHVLTG